MTMMMMIIIAKSSGFVLIIIIKMYLSKALTHLKLCKFILSPLKIIFDCQKVKLFIASIGILTLEVFYAMTNGNFSPFFTDLCLFI